MAEKIEDGKWSAHYIAGLQKNGQFGVATSPPGWTKGEVPGSANEAEADARIAAGWRNRNRISPCFYAPIFSFGGVGYQYNSLLNQ